MAPIWPAEHFAKIVVSEQCFHEKKKEEKKQVAISPFLNIFVHFFISSHLMMFFKCFMYYMHQKYEYRLRVLPALGGHYRHHSF
ncbi:hypothetical protein T12_11220 [Trichinella patagoniensis]|uniref:Uncharacterized protein n=1 Tax=Trichinella patagoniensis TaxID=990121 RepID=A0A0V0ZSD1_9BILA|nr:hypothetical protein T12_11220 [Trichinella patagoniensis]